MTMMQRATARTSEREAFYDRNGGFNKAPLWERLHGSVIARPTPRHGNFRCYLKTFGLITMVGASATLAMPIGKAQASGDFILSCNNTRLNAVDFSETAMLMAECTRKNGSTNKKASINLNDLIANIQGTLKWATHGDFQETCYQSSLMSLYHSAISQSLAEGSPLASKPRLLDANCDQFFPNASKIELNDHITNDNGNLKYDP